MLPPLVGVLAFLFLYGETGFVSLLVQRLFGLDEPPWRLQGAGAILLVHAYSMYVYFYLFTRAALAVARRVALRGGGEPRRRAVAHAAAGGAAAARSRARRRGAAHVHDVARLVQRALHLRRRLSGHDHADRRHPAQRRRPARDGGDDRRSPLLALAALWLFRGARPVDGAAGGRKGAAPGAASRSGAGRCDSLVAVAGWGLAVLLLLPHLTLLLVSFVPLGTWTTEPMPPAYTLRNYLTLVQDPVRARPLVNSLWLATVATVAAVAIALGRRPGCPRGAVRGAARHRGAAGAALGGAGDGVRDRARDRVQRARAAGPGASCWSGRSGSCRWPISCGTCRSPAAPCWPGSARSIPSLDEAAATLGAGRWRTLRRVTLPLLRPALLAGASLAFVTALGDFVTSIMLYTYDTRPVSLEILSSLRQADIGVAAAYGVVLMLVSAAVFARRRRPGQRRMTPTPDGNRARLRRLAVLIVVCFVDMIGFMIVLPLLPFYATQARRQPRDGRPADRVVLHRAAAVGAGLGPGVGSLRAPARAADRALSASAVAYVVFGFADAVWLLFASRIVQGAGGGTTGVAQAYVADTVEPKDRARALGWLSAATSAGVIFGPAIGSFASRSARRRPGSWPRGSAW